MDLPGMSVWYWIIPLLTGVIGGIVGFLMGRRNRGLETHQQVRSLTESCQKAKEELEACRKQLAAANSEAVLEEIPYDYKAARTVFGETVQKDDLKIIEGIGPKIESLFHNYDIKTWRSLAETSVAKCQEVLDSGGDRYKIHDPSSWPLQARMAHENKWKELSRWQDEHKRGKL
ncbi:hypothetical protein [Robiginitalea sp. SC105]|uniref:hypothetical protein n=1 Tax=Robiginitalea sp. SC105 TaxID=2762332 RepID=UPI00163A564C|nr:hypothetical protein [Robiginitalea sp. SC105]MBC2838037.1 hypothetical protein [Robiginitalea sp. SC105]